MKFHTVKATEDIKPGEAVTKAVAEGIARLFPLPHHPESVSRLISEQEPEDVTAAQSSNAARNPNQV